MASGSKPEWVEEMAALQLAHDNLAHKIKKLEAGWKASEELHRVVRNVLKACRLGGYLTYLQRAEAKMAEAEKEFEQG